MNNEVNEYIAKGVEAYRKGDYSAAIKSYSKAIELDPRDSGGHSNRSLVYMTLGEYEKARLDREVAFQLNPQLEVSWRAEAELASDAYIAMANDCVQSDDWPQALEFFTESIRFFPEQVDGHIGRGVVYYEQDQFDLAIDAHSEALRLSPGNLEALYNRAISYMQLDDYINARADLLTYKSIDNVDPQATNMLDICNQKLNPT